MVCRSSRSRFIAVLLIIMVPVLIWGCKYKATMVLKNGHIYTMDGNNTVATAIALYGDRIMYVGNDQFVNMFIGKDTEVIDLAGKMVVPGFVDGHGHPPAGQLEALTDLMLGNLEPDLDVYREALRAYAEQHADDPVLTGTGMQINLFGEDGPNKSFIDEIVSDKPVLLKDSSYHGVLVNTKALEISGITRDTEDPPGGKILKDENGERDARHAIVHANLIDPDDILRMGEMDIYAAMQPIWFYADPIFAGLELQMLGQERFDQEYSIRDMVEAGIHISGSADQPVTPDDRPLAGIETGVTQGAPYPGMQGDPQFVRDENQTVSVMEMLHMYTINGAKQLRMDNLIGSLEFFKKADMVILAQDITKTDPLDIAETDVVATIVDGKVVYEMK